MPYRLASNAVWHSLPGVVCALQPVGAPDAIAARQNIGWWHRMLGNYTATPGVAPTWAARTGWGFNGTTQYLTTGVVPVGGLWSMLIRYSSLVNDGYLCGSQNAGTAKFNISPRPNALGVDGWEYGATGKVDTTGSTNGVMGLVISNGYKNGLLTVTAMGTWAGTPRAIFIGDRNVDGIPYAGGYANVKVQAFAIYSRVLTPAEMWLASMQMKYCDVNPEWNAWAPRRRYWIAPAAAGGAVGIYGKRHELRIPGGVRIEATK